MKLISTREMVDTIQR